jgi:hypothetical protein
MATKGVIPMSDVPTRNKPFTTVEADFLEAGEQMDLAAQTATPADGEVTYSGPSPRQQVAKLLLGRWGAVCLVATGALVVGGASLRVSRGPASATTTLAVETSAALAAPIGAGLPVSDSRAREISGEPLLNADHHAKPSSGQHARSHNKPARRR